MMERYKFSSTIIMFLLAFVLSTVCVYAVDTDGLVLYYSFDNEESKVITDLSGTGNNATIKGNPKWEQGKNGEALEFNANGDFLEVPDSDSLKSDEITIALWVKWTGDLLPAKPVQKYTYQEGGYVFKMEGEETNMWIYDTAKNAHMYRAVPLPTPGEWTHLAVTFDGEVQRGYVNGIKGEKGGNVDMFWAGPIGHVNVPLQIGASGGDTFTGLIDEIAIYSRALSEEEILESMEIGHGTIAVQAIGKLPLCWGSIKVDLSR